MNITHAAPRLGRLTEALDPQEVHQPVLRLPPGHARQIPGEMHLVHVISGHAWITANGEDIVVQKGQWAYVPSGHYPAVISAAGGNSLVYEIC